MPKIRVLIVDDSVVIRRHRIPPQRDDLFDIESKKTILGKIRRLLRPGGLLLLGGAETTFNLDDSFERSVIEKTTCYRVKKT
jgi:hypothetical protein